MSEKKRFRIGNAVVNICSMKQELSELVVSNAEVSMRDNMTEQEMASDLKGRLTKVMPDSTWQVFVGRNFGAYVTYEEGKYIYFYINQMGFCVFVS